MVRAARWDAVAAAVSGLDDQLVGAEFLQAVGALAGGVARFRADGVPSSPSNQSFGVRVSWTYCWSTSGSAGHRAGCTAPLLAATLFAHEPATFGEHGSAGLYDHGGPLAASMSTISPG